MTKEFIQKTAVDTIGMICVVVISLIKKLLKVMDNAYYTTYFMLAHLLIKEC